MSVDISVIIVNYNGASYLKNCLDSVLQSRGPTKEIILIDNASTDASMEKIAAYRDQIRVIENTVNRGFSAANNQGLAVATGHYVFLLNNDTEIGPSALETLMGYFQTHQGIGAIGPRLLNGDRSLQTPGSIFGRHWYRTDRPREVSFISGAAFFSTRAILKQLGGLDENFFFYNEDVDLCMRLKKAGYRLIYLPQVQVVHFGGLATATRQAPSIVEGYRGGLYLCFKHYPGWVFVLYRWVLFLYLMIRIAIYGCLMLFKPAYQSTFKAYKQVFWLNVRRNFKYHQGSS